MSVAVDLSASGLFHLSSFDIVLCAQTQRTRRGVGQHRIQFTPIAALIEPSEHRRAGYAI